MARQVVFYYCAITYVTLFFDPIRTSLELPTEEFINFPELAKKEQDYLTATALGVLLSVLVIFVSGQSVLQ